MLKPAVTERASRPIVDASAAARFLADARHRAGLSREALAEKTGLSRACIYNIESGRTAPHRSTREVLAEVLGVDELSLRGVAADFPAWLRIERTRVGWSQGRLADEVGIRQTFVSEIELGQAIPRPVVAQRIVDALESWEQREARYRYERGETFGEIGEALGFSAETAKRRVVEAGGQPRSPKGRTLARTTRVKMSMARRGKTRQDMKAKFGDREWRYAWGVRLVDCGRSSRPYHANTLRRWKGRLEGLKAGRLGGKGRGYTDKHIELARSLKDRDRRSVAIVSHVCSR